MVILLNCVVRSVKANRRARIETAVLNDMVHEALAGRPRYTPDKEFNRRVSALLNAEIATGTT